MVPRSPLSSNTNETTIVFVLHRTVFPDLPDTFPEFKRLLQSLSRTDAIFWCARLNILISDTRRNPTDTQGSCMGTFLSPSEVDRVNVFALQHGGANKVRVFFRGQLLELLRWIVLFSSDHADDGRTFDDESNRRTFIRAALIASDIWQRRVYRNRLEGNLSVNQLRANALPLIRLMSMEIAPTPDPFFDLARGASLFVDRMRTRAPDVDGAFQQATGLSMVDYFSMLAQVAADGLGKGPDGLRDPMKCGIFGAKGYEDANEPVGTIAKAFLAGTAQSADDLRTALWGALTDADERDSETFNLKPLRERPLFRTPDGRAIILDPRLFIERGSAGPLFHLAGTGNAQRWFAAFGEVFEDYAQDILRRVYPDAPGLARRFFPKPKGRSADGQKVDLNDALVVTAESLVVFEMKAVWMPDAVVSPNADATSYMTDLRNRYGVSENPRQGDRPVKGLGQLARTVRNLGDSSWSTDDPPLTGIKRLMPVLVVHDPHVDAPLHSHALAQEFARYLGGVHETNRWRELERGPYQVSHLIVITLDDLESLETSSNNFALVDCLEAYATSCPDRIMSFHNFLATSQYREKLRSNAWLVDRCLELLKQCQARLFPSSVPLGDSTSTSQG